MIKKSERNILNSSRLLENINKVKEGFNFDNDTKAKLNKLFEKLSGPNFFDDDNIKKNLKLIFFVVRMCVLGFVGYKNKFLFSSMFADKVIYLVKIFYKDCLENEMIYLKSYYEMKRYLEEEYLEKNNLYPIYACSCGRWYTIKDSNGKDSLPFETKDCICGLKIGGNIDKLVERENLTAIHYDENHNKLFETRIYSKNNNRDKLRGILLKEFKSKFIINRIINKCEKLNKLLLSNCHVINDENLPSIFLAFVLLSQIFIEYTIGSTTENEIMTEFNKINIFEDLIKLNNKIEEYIISKNINYNYFLSYYSDTLFKLLKTKDCIREKDTIIDELSKLLKQLGEKYISESENLIFKNIEMNTLTSLTYENHFTNGNLKYLLTAAQYPDLEKLYKAINLYDKKPLSILNAFISLNAKNSEVEKLSHIETINQFINTFAKENWYLISRQSSETYSIDYYLKEYRKNNYPEEEGQSILDIQFENFCQSYEKITNTFPFKITKDSPVKYILNDDKIKGKETPINKLYSYLIDIQNEYMNELIAEYYKKGKLKKNIIIENSIEQIQIEKPIQLCSKNDIFSFKILNNDIKSFDELFSFYSFRNIFNGKDDKIDYSKYSEIKFELNMIESELENIILTGKKLFSKKQITYKFYLDPFEVEEKTKKFEKFTELYGRDNLTDEEKEELKKQVPSLKRIILPNLEILIFYLIQENNYQGTQKINQIKFHSNLYFNKKFIQLFNDNNKFTINKLISIYEFFEEVLWEFISDRYINEVFKSRIYITKFKRILDDFYDKESERKLKNDLLTSLLIKFVCRYLPYEPKESASRDLFQMLLEKNMNLPEEIKKDLQEMKNYFGAKLRDAIDITAYFSFKNRGNNEIIIDEKDIGEEEEEEESDFDRDRDL